MKVVPGQVSRIAKLYHKRQIEYGGKPGQVSLGKDSVDLSTEGKRIQALKQHISQLPTVREEKVAQLKARIQAGTYQVSAEKVAEKMVEEFLAAKRGN
ncbi:MAG: flagellar biosynthesis anti-sigma factor FlgM [Firmicutes bacterium]|nr:flagellar biosynthesis anti-sigma factor FlgM [Bacillota bacterium]